MMRRFAKSSVLLIVVIVIAPFVLCRLPIGAKIEATDRVYINKSPHFLETDLRAKYFEELLGNERLFISGGRELWVSKEDYRNVWSTPPKRAIRYSVYPVVAGFGRAYIHEAFDTDTKRRQEAQEQYDSLIREAKKNDKQKLNHTAEPVSPSRAGST